MTSRESYVFRVLPQSVSTSREANVHRHGVARASGHGPELLRAVYFVASPDLARAAAGMHSRRDPRRWEERVVE